MMNWDNMHQRTLVIVAGLEVLEARSHKSHTQLPLIISGEIETIDASLRNLRTCNADVVESQVFLSRRGVCLLDS